MLGLGQDMADQHHHGGNPAERLKAGELRRAHAGGAFAGRERLWDVKTVAGRVRLFGRGGAAGCCFASLRRPAIRASENKRF